MDAHPAGNAIERRDRQVRFRNAGRIECRRGIGQGHDAAAVVHLDVDLDPARRVAIAVGDDVRGGLVDRLDHVVEGVVRGIGRDHLPADELAHLGQPLELGVDPQVGAQRASSGAGLGESDDRRHRARLRAVVRTPA